MITVYSVETGCLTKSFLQVDGYGLNRRNADFPELLSTERRQFASLEELHTILAEISQDTQKAVCWSLPKDGDLQRESRAGRMQAGPQYWLTLDFDKLPVGFKAPADITDLNAVALALWKHLPNWLRACDWLLQASASHGTPDDETGLPMVRLRLWVLCTVQVDQHHAQWIAKEVGADPSVFSAGQPIFTANPVFTNMPDPMQGKPRFVLLKDQDRACQPPPMPARPVHMPTKHNANTPSGDANRDKAVWAVNVLWRSGRIGGSGSGTYATTVYPTFQALVNEFGKPETAAIFEEATGASIEAVRSGMLDGIEFGVGYGLGTPVQLAREAYADLIVQFPEKLTPGIRATAQAVLDYTTRHQRVDKLFNDKCLTRDQVMSELALIKPELTNGGKQEYRFLQRLRNTLDNHADWRDLDNWDKFDLILAAFSLSAVWMPGDPAYAKFIISRVPLPA